MSQIQNMLLDLCYLYKKSHNMSQNLSKKFYITNEWDALWELSSYRWVPLKLDFLGAWKSVWLKHNLAYPIILISLIIQGNLAKKSRLSGNPAWPLYGLSGTHL